ncbi:hypothetical protein K493DRAFT_312775 [Basidiobolus meristosporus CBS 931.73]|uniref:Exonuclease domain-containing protein n=1 Tax=Basidiobolus meristosporus CBS 931.73 TaxID=1314790 RepID=A0A1Y1YSL0_9FUNG|nr:hypothetical protein K493DRAFT_312775 [Basidiobolus meristosporus CBS 931.73]|eukprot:ORY00565.1 hypothetical protein K493DRAFT_312775 [Basidiobolus meristosporus CBS 931.73]
MSLKDPIFAVDVECIATGRGHNDRAVCSVAVVDQNLDIVFERLVKPSLKIHNYLTPITGFKEGDLDKGEPLEVVLRDLYSFLPTNSILIGQAIDGDISWLELKQGVHFKERVDLAEEFATRHPVYGSMMYYSLAHTSRVLLGYECFESGGSHSAANDAKASMMLYKEYIIPKKAKYARHILSVATRPLPSIAKRMNYRCDDVCMAAYMPKFCFCGTASKQSTA